MLSEAIVKLIGSGQGPQMPGKSIGQTTGGGEQQYDWNAQRDPNDIIPGR